MAFTPAVEIPVDSFEFGMGYVAEHNKAYGKTVIIEEEFPLTYNYVATGAKVLSKSFILEEDIPLVARYSHYEAPGYSYSAYAYAEYARPAGGDAVEIVLEADTIPVAQFYGVPLTGEAPLSVTFINQSYNPISGYLWNFGDGNESTAVNPTHIYTASGVYTVILVAYSYFLHSDSEVKVAYITVLPAAEPALAFRLQSTQKDPEDSYIDRITRELNLNRVAGGVFNETPYLREQQRPPIVKEKIILGDIEYYKLKESTIPPPAIEPVKKPVFNDKRLSAPLPLPKKRKPGINKKIYKDSNGNIITIFI